MPDATPDTEPIEVPAIETEGGPDRWSRERAEIVWSERRTAQDRDGRLGKLSPNLPHAVSELRSLGLAWDGVAARIGDAITWPGGRGPSATALANWYLPRFRTTEGA